MISAAFSAEVDLKIVHEKPFQVRVLGGKMETFKPFSILPIHHPSTSKMGHIDNFSGDANHAVSPFTRMDSGEPTGRRKTDGTIPVA